MKVFLVCHYYYNGCIEMEYHEDIAIFSSKEKALECIKTIAKIFNDTYGYERYKESKDLEEYKSDNGNIYIKEFELLDNITDFKLNMGNFYSMGGGKCF